MTSLNLASPYSAHTRIPLMHEKNVHRNPLLSTVKKYRKGYSGLNIILSWAEKVVNPKTSRFFSSKRRVLKQQSSALAIPGWFENAIKLSNDLKEIKTAKDGKARWAAIKKMFFSSLTFTNSSISVARVLNTAHFIDLTEFSASLPHTMSGISSVVGMTLSVDQLYHNSRKWHVPSTCKEACEWAADIDATKAWDIIDASRVVLGFCSAVLAILFFFFGIIFSTYLLLGITTYTFFVTLAKDLPEMSAPNL
jgi:hypothetical protein